jgi:NAD(P)-dependent dehydrogenase (short-subunit alcohol dehydrogenase family)
MELGGRVAIVTGAGRVEGLGFAIARRLGSLGATLVISDVDDPSLTPALAELGRLGFRVAGVVGDVAEPDTADRAVATAVDSFGRVDILVNNAAVWTTFKVLEWKKAEWCRVLDINTTAPFLWTQSVIRQLLAQGSGGSIVNIISVAAQMVVLEELLAYETSKAATLHMTHGLASAFAHRQIRVNNVLPGPMATGRTRVRGQATLRRRAEPDEIARVVAFLAGDAGSYVTGADWRVDGGLWIGLAGELGGAAETGEPAK